MNRCRSSREVMRRAFERERVTAPRARALWEHLAECDRCRADFDALAIVARTAARGAGGPSAWELSLMESRVLASVDSRAERRRPRAWVLGLAAAGALGSAALLLVPRPPPADGPWRARGGPGETLAVRALCETVDLTGAPIVRSWVETPGPQEVDSCPAGARVRLAYMASTPGLLYVATSGDGSPPTWARGAGAPMLVAEAAKLTLLPLDLTESARAARRTLEVIAVLAEQPLSSETLDRAVHPDAAGPFTTNRQVLRMAPGDRERRP